MVRDGGRCCCGGWLESEGRCSHLRSPSVIEKSRQGAIKRAVWRCSSGQGSTSHWSLQCCVAACVKAAAECSCRPCSVVRVKSGCIARNTSCRRNRHVVELDHVSSCERSQKGMVAAVGAERPLKPNLHAEPHAGIDGLLRHLDVGERRRRIARGMVVTRMIAAAESSSA